MRFALAAVLAAIPALALASPEAAPPAAAPAPPKALALGSSLPMGDASLLNVDGRKLTLAGLRKEKGLLVVFTCNHCPYAKAWEDRILEVAKLAPGQGFGVALLNPNDPGRVPQDGYESMQARAKEKSYAAPYLVDDGAAVAKAFGASRTPEVFLFDANGKLAYHGAVDDDAEKPENVKSRYLKDALEAVAAGRAPATPDTKAIGCSIKFKPAA